MSFGVERGTLPAALASSRSLSRRERLRTWWNEDDVEINVRRWFPTAFMIVLIGAIFRQPVLVLLGMLVFAFSLGVRLWWDVSLRGLTYDRTLSGTRAVHGETVTLEITVVNAKPVPITRLEVLDEVTANIAPNTIKLEYTDRRDIRGLRTFFSLGMYERVTYRYQIPTTVRGRHSIGPAILTATDPFGLVTRERRKREIDSFVVYPRIVPVSTVVVPARQPFGDDRPVQPVVEDPMRMAGVREYVPGDSPRRIHWRATARVGRLQTRVFEPSASPIAAIFLDTITFSQMWEGQNLRLLELAITVTGSIASDLLGRRQQVGLYANAPIPLRARTIRIPPARRPSQLARILEQLALLHSVYGDRIERLVAEEVPKLPWGATIVIVTTNVTETMQRTLLRLARTSGNGRYVLVAIGDVPQLVPDLRRRVTVYHLGAEETWDVIQRIAFTRLH
jgi:uncharacterized protein (DUF58 family)